MRLAFALEKKAAPNKAKRKKEERKRAKTKVPELFERATQNKNEDVANRLIRRARKMAMKFRIALQPYKHTYCTSCYTRLIPAQNCRIRIHDGKVIYYCFACKNFRRIPVHKTAKKVAEKKEAHSKRRKVRKVQKVAKSTKK